MKKYQHFINGEFVDPIGGDWFDTINPYTAQPWAQIPKGCAQDIDRAVQYAKQAMYSGPFSRMSASARGKLLYKVGELLQNHTSRLAEIEVRDNGKLIAEMAGQLNYLPEFWRYYAGLADKIEGTVVPIDKPDHLAYKTYEPVGVVGALAAWNSPLMFVAWKAAPAIAAGCSIVLKPSEYTSASALEFAELTVEAGFPPGVFNVVTGLGQDAGAALVSHPDVEKISFTGSDATGAKLYSIAASQMKRVSMELGGKSPNIVFADANLDAAASGAVSGIFAATGQTCIAGSRLLVQNSIKDEFTDKLLRLAKTARMGDPMSYETHIGPVATPPQYQKILDYIDIAKTEGANLLHGGSPATGAELSGEQFIQPTIFGEVTNNMRIAQEEVFGPVLSILGFDDEEEAVQIGNDIVYGLAAGVWTQNIGRAVRMSQALRAGTVWVNTYRAVSYMMPFGGRKRSGVGRENGIDAIYEFLESKSVWINTSDEFPENPFVMR